MESHNNSSKKNKDNEEEKDSPKEPKGNFNSLAMSLQSSYDRSQKLDFGKEKSSYEEGEAGGISFMQKGGATTTPQQGMPTGQNYPPQQGMPTGQHYPPQQGMPTGQHYPPQQGTHTGYYPPQQGMPTGQHYPPQQGMPTGQHYPPQGTHPAYYPPQQGMPTGQHYPPQQGMPTGQYPPQQGMPTGQQYPPQQGSETVGIPLPPGNLGGPAPPMTWQNTNPNLQIPAGGWPGGKRNERAINAPSLSEITAQNRKISDTMAHSPNYSAISPSSDVTMKMSTAPGTKSFPSLSLPNDATLKISSPLRNNAGNNTVIQSSLDPSGEVTIGMEKPGQLSSPPPSILGRGLGRGLGTGEATVPLSKPENTFDSVVPQASTLNMNTSELSENTMAYQKVSLDQENTQMYSSSDQLNSPSHSSSIPGKNDDTIRTKMLPNSNFLGEETITLDTGSIQDTMAEVQKDGTETEPTVNFSPSEYLKGDSTMNMNQEQYLPEIQDMEKTAHNMSIVRSSTQKRAKIILPQGAIHPKSSEPIQTKGKDPFRLMGTTIGGKFEVVDFLGQGGMGAVYLCKHNILNKLRAIKVLLKTDGIDPTIVHRFINEARAAALVEHPNIVQVHDIDEMDDFYFIIMDFVEGESLDNYVKQRGPLSPVDAANVIVSACQGLKAIHLAGLIHRDIKPGNFLLTKKGSVKITDFGIVKEIGGEGELTATTTILGTPQYMAPEQIRKEPLDLRTDLYSLGATFYYLVTGQSCFTGSAMQLLYQVLGVPPVPPQDINTQVDEKLSRIIQKMVEKEPARRYQMMEEVEEALRGWGL